jgi:hypothetical protein
MRPPDLLKVQPIAGGEELPNGFLRRAGMGAQLQREQRSAPAVHEDFSEVGPSLARSPASTDWRAVAIVDFGATRTGQNLLCGSRTACARTRLAPQGSQRIVDFLRQQAVQPRHTRSMNVPADALFLHLSSARRRLSVAAAVIVVTSTQVTQLSRPRKTKAVDSSSSYSVVEPPTAKLQEPASSATSAFRCTGFAIASIRRS